jgi:site-specific recombinase XerD
MQDGMLYPGRNRAILELCYGSGLRRGELHGLNMADVHDSWLRVIGKGNRERMVPLGSKAKMWLNVYIRKERTLLTGKNNPLEEALFLNRFGNRLGLQMYSYIVTYKRPKDAKWTLHSFRHACATHMLENGASIRVIQKMLGHKKLSSTQVYTRVEVSSLKEVLKKYHPRG